MKTLDLGRCALTSCLAAAMLAGCGGSQPPIGAASAMQQSPAISQRATDGRSWMRPDASAGDLIYATDGCGGTCVFSYPRARLVGSLDVGTEGTCSDSSGDVYIADKNNLYEYAHGGASPIAAFNFPNLATLGGCSVDPSNGDLAVTLAYQGYNVAVIPKGSGSPVTYNVPNDVQWCGYDDSDDLFVDAYGNSGQNLFQLYELLKGGSSLVNIANALQVRPGQIQWDGRYLAIEGIGVNPGDPLTIYRATIEGSSLKIEGSTQIDGLKVALASWVKGAHIFIPYGTHGPRTNRIGVWGYPGGRAIRENFKGIAGARNFQAVTFSVAPSR